MSAISFKCPKKCEREWSGNSFHHRIKIYIFTLTIRQLFLAGDPCHQEGHFQPNSKGQMSQSGKILWVKLPMEAHGLRHHFRLVLMAVLIRVRYVHFKSWLPNTLIALNFHLRGTLEGHLSIWMVIVTRCMVLFLGALDALNLGFQECMQMLLKCKNGSLPKLEGNAPNLEKEISLYKLYNIKSSQMCNYAGINCNNLH